jgi:uncharacterized membrane protein
MKNISKKILVSTAVGSVIALGLNTYSPKAIAEDMNMEKCSGIVKAGKNDCAANGHDCSGMSKKDADANEWMALPQGTCDKIVSAKVVGNEKPQNIKKTEKCSGIVKAGKNDCAAAGHSCAGKATKSSDANEWIYVPKGSCNKIVGATVKK